MMAGTMAPNPSPRLYRHAAMEPALSDGWAHRSPVCMSDPSTGFGRVVVAILLADGTLRAADRHP